MEKPVEIEYQKYSSFIDKDTQLKIFNFLKDILNKKTNEYYKILGPKSVQLELTNECNLKCNMCDRWKWKYEGKDLKGNLKKHDIFNLLEELKELGLKHILITGGEPLIRNDFNDILTYANNLDLAITLITNGILLKRETATTIAKTNSSIIFSVDASNKITYKKIRGINLYDRLIDNIKMMVEIRDKYNRSKIEMHFVTQKNNASEIILFYELCKSLNVDKISYSIAHGPHLKDRKIVINKNSLKSLKDDFNQIKDSNKPQVSIRDIFQEILDDNIPFDNVKRGLPVISMFEKNPVPCYSLSYWAFIDAFGDVYPCCYSYFDNLAYNKYKNQRNKFCLGNIHKNSFADIWNGEKFNHYRNKMDPVDISNFPNVCGQCSSYFFFKKIFDEINALKKKINDDNELISDIIDQAISWIDSLETIDRSGKIGISYEMAKIFNNDI